MKKIREIRKTERNGQKGKKVKTYHIMRKVVHITKYETI